MIDMMQSYLEQISHISMVMLLVNALIHVLFAGAVAKDAGKLLDQNRSLVLVSGITWAFATLVGGVWVAALYWLLHHVQFPQRP